MSSVDFWTWLPLVLMLGLVIAIGGCALIYAPLDIALTAGDTLVTLVPMAP